MKKNTQTQKNQNHLKPKQQKILKLFLKFRYLNQKQLQLLLNHKAKERVRLWLNELTEKKYISKYYENIMAKKPSVYCLDTAGISYLRSIGTDAYFLKRVYKDKTKSHQFREHCLFVATVYISLLTKTKESEAQFRFDTNSDLSGTHYLILPYPDAYFHVKESKGKLNQYFLEVFDNSAYPFKRLYQYLTYYKKNYWQYTTKTEFPEIIFICPDDYTKKRIYRYMQGKLTKDSPVFYLSTREQILKYGMSPIVLKKVTI